jgi:DNA-directed RNA polymerase specialized sigma24 family protein
MSASSILNARSRTSIRRTRWPLLLTYRDGLHHAQIAALLGCSARTIYYLLPAAKDA